MPNEIHTCPIWGEKYEAEGFYFPQTRVFHIDNSLRAGGAYLVSEVDCKAYVSKLDDAGKARLTTWLIDQRIQGDNQPTVTEEIVNYVKNRPPLPVHERADRLLRLIAKQSETVGARISILGSSPEAYAWSESINWDEVDYFTDYLKAAGWIQGGRTAAGGLTLGLVTVSGYNRIAEQSTNTDSAQAFVAMWFGQDMTEVYDQGIKPAIEEAGYNPMRIDRKLDVEKIDDAIVAEIRRSRFLVADFTHGQDGARGGVYFEAGFAMGLAMPVIFTCRSDMVTKLHFDTRQYAHIVWSTPDKLYFDLRDRILARIGPGPAFDKVAPLRERLPRKSLGQWLVDNVPRGTNLEIPDRNDSGREIPLLDLDEESQ